MLRGINLGSHNRIAMPALQAALEKMGLGEVKIYLQSGNAVFQSDKTALELSADIETMIKTEFGFDVPTVVRTSKEIRNTLAYNPYLKDSEIDPINLYVTFLQEKPSAELVTTVAAGFGGADTWTLDGKTIYLHTPGGYGKTKLTNNLFERKFKTTATTRNWKTVTSLENLSQ